MRKALLLLSVLVVAVMALVAATTANAASIYAVGAGSTDLGTGNKHFIQFSVSAHNGKTRDSGQVQFQINDPTFELDVRVAVDCVNVFPFLLTNGAAWITGAATRVSPQPNFFGIVPGDRLDFYALDGGNQSSSAPVDQFDPVLIPNPLPCELFPAFPYGPNVTQGNVNISTG